MPLIRLARSWSGAVEPCPSMREGADLRICSGDTHYRSLVPDVNLRPNPPIRHVTSALSAPSALGRMAAALPQTVLTFSLPVRPRTVVRHRQGGATVLR